MEQNPPRTKCRQRSPGFSPSPRASRFGKAGHWPDRGYREVVMPGPVPGIRVLAPHLDMKDVDGRDKLGHDERSVLFACTNKRQIDPGDAGCTIRRKCPRRA